MLALRLRIAAATLGLGAMAFSAPAEARGFGGFHGGGTMRGVGHFRNPVVIVHPGPFHSPVVDRRAFVSRQLFFHRRFVGDRRFFFDGHRFVGPFANGFVGPGYSASAYDYAYETSPDDQGMTQPSSQYDDPYNVSEAYDRTGHADFPLPALGQDFTPSPTPRRGCSLEIRVEKSEGHLVVHRIPLCNADTVIEVHESAIGP